MPNPPIALRLRARLELLAVPNVTVHELALSDESGTAEFVVAVDRPEESDKNVSGRSTRDENKFGRLAQFARALPLIRRRIAADLRLPGLPREKVLATVVQLVLLVERSMRKPVSLTLLSAHVRSTREGYGALAVRLVGALSAAPGDQSVRRTR